MRQEPVRPSASRQTFRVSETLKVSLNAAQWARYEIVQAGLLASDSPRSICEITEAGHAYLREHRADISVNTE